LISLLKKEIFFIFSAKIEILNIAVKNSPKYRFIAQTKPFLSKHL